MPTTHFGQALEDFNLQTLWQHLTDLSNFESKKTNVEAFNKSNRWKKRGVSLLPTKFGISFTTKFMNQGGFLVHVSEHRWFSGKISSTLYAGPIHISTKYMNIFQRNTALDVNSQTYIYQQAMQTAYAGMFPSQAKGNVE
ncbi:hypothetical protein PsorP6_000574 [Peronosclerospora sorghi]|uniref:Uncharacterized protein n=1 Tax=Peronosclerospora sorghi TaxID=230839 RepID=A0ACC0WPZ9_9STRA|nr:hypothetical protein PsorP6_000574 [Peronosclerospora sorghi]